ncbi:MAG TPA: SurA N-terminal domain-containing protein, partial [Desulfurivibrionaceae bacterium]|nr:SurA N-terminal domain-containing protein [Desulfurivibrionaceae bacterium]
MRYLYAIAVFVLLVSASFLAYRFYPATTATEDVAIQINDRIITRAEFNQKYQSRGGVQDPFTAQPGEDFIQALITKELLIQEAKRLGLDREEPFRQSVQNFYEQSLI